MVLDYVETTYDLDKIVSLLKEDKIIFKEKSSILDNFIPSEFMESIILRMIMYPFIVRLKEDEVFKIIDGNKRLLAIKNFINGELILEDLKFLPQFCNKNFSQLPRFVQRRIEEQQFRFFIIRGHVPTETINYFIKNF